MTLAALRVTALKLVVFGAFGGLMLLVGLDGVSERTGGLVILGYVLLLLALVFLVSR